ncbi:MAG: hypothetical protein BM556_16415 [Bacteriovorax sp. MedPE-SWde]|nr:MAG: hypothetical protein BM556_16415 [Bacteriovorax sp. MedPE-SWde]
MSQLFNYKTFSVSLSRELKNCTVSVLNDSEQFSSFKFIDELELFFDWVTSKTEIASILIETSDKELELLNQSELKFLDEKAIYNFLKKVQRLSWGQIVLPQTVIWNFQNQVDFLTMELAAGADIRTCGASFTLAFDSLSKGVTPMASGSCLMSKLTNSSIIKANLLSNKVENAERLIGLGIIHTICYADEVRKTLRNISLQSPIARIQFKRSINDELIRNIDELMVQELTFAKATLAIGDWKKWANDKEFSNPREFSKILRKTPTVEQVRQENFQREMA